MRRTLFVSLLFFYFNHSLCAPSGSDFIFKDDLKDSNGDEIITPPVLPVIEHLENDPTTLLSEDNEVISRNNFKGGSKHVKGGAPRFGFSGSFGVSGTEDGGLSASFGHGLQGLGGHNSAGSHSVSLGPASQGFQVSQSSSQSSSFGGSTGLLGTSVSGSQSSSHSASFSAGFQGVNGASSGASSSSHAGNLLGQGFSNSNAQSQSSAGSLGLQGVSSAFGQSSSQAASYPGQTFANGQSNAGSFGEGAVGQAFGSGSAQNSNGFAGSSANSQSSAAVNGALSQGGGFAGQSNYAPQHGFGPESFDPRDGSRGFVFPGPSSDRYRNLPYRSSQPEYSSPNIVRWHQYSLPYTRPGGYQVIKIEV